MGLGRRTEASPEARQWLGNLLVAWTFVTGLSAAFASAWYTRTGDIKILIAYLGAPFALGLILFASLVIYGLATREERRAPEEPNGRRARTTRLHGRAAPLPRRFIEPIDPRVPRPAPSTQEGALWDRVTIRCRPAEADMMDYHRVALELAHARVAIAVLALAAGVGWMQLLAPAYLALDPFQAAPIAVLGVGLVLLAALLWRPRRLARRALRNETLLETTWRVGPEGLEIVDARGRGTYHWTAVENVRETSGIFLLRTSDGTAHVISKRTAEPDIVRKLRDVLRAHAGDRAALRAA